MYFITFLLAATVFAAACIASGMVLGMSFVLAERLL